VSEWWEGVMGNREGPHNEIPITCADDSGAGERARLREEGGSRGKHGFPRAMKPKAEEALA
jgi:hypothetical protein